MAFLRERSRLCCLSACLRRAGTSAASSETSPHLRQTDDQRKRCELSPSAQIDSGSVARSPPDRHHVSAADRTRPPSRFDSALVRSSAQRSDQRKQCSRKHWKTSAEVHMLLLS